MRKFRPQKTVYVEPYLLQEINDFMLRKDIRIFNSFAIKAMEYYIRAEENNEKMKQERLLYEETYKVAYKTMYLCGYLVRDQYDNETVMKWVKRAEKEAEKDISERFKPD